MEEDRDGARREAKVVIVAGLTRNVRVAHLKEIFGTYGEITGVDLPTYPSESRQLLPERLVLTETRFAALVYAS